MSASNNDSYNSARRAPRSRRAVEEEEEEAAAAEEAAQGRPARRPAQGSFRRPTPGVVQSNAFSRNSKSSGFTSRGSSAPVAVDVKEAPAPRKQRGVFARVLYDFPGEDEDELPLREGQRVRVTRQHESGWWKMVLYLPQASPVAQ